MQRAASMKIAFLGSSLASSYLNGRATCYRRLLKSLAGSGHDITFFEPDAPDHARQIVAAARARVPAHRTYVRRAREVDALSEGMRQKGEAAA